MIEQISPRQLAQWAGQHADAGKLTVLDVREPAELQIASVRPDGFTLLAVPMREVPMQLSALDPAQPLAILCHHGGRSLQVATYLADHGFERIANIAGGIDAWSRELDHTVPRY